MSAVLLGKAGGRNVSLDLDTLLPTRLLIQANSGGGKSWLIRRIAEQLFGKIPIHIIDREGEFASLREKFPFVLIGEGGEAAADVRSAGLVAQRLLELRASAVIDLYEAFGSQPLQRRQWVRKYLEALIDAPKKLWKPLIVIVDEAQLFCPQESPKGKNNEEREIINGCKDAMIALSSQGRKRRFCAVWATQRLAKLDKDASAELMNRIIGLTFEDVDIERAADMLSITKDEKREFKQTIRVQEPGNWYAVGRAISKTRIRFRAGEVLTSHPDVSSTTYDAGPPPTPEKIKALLPKLSDLPKEAEEKARTEAEYKARIRELERDLKTARRAQPAASPAKPPVVDPRMIERERKLGIDAANRAVREVKASADKHLAQRDRAITILVNGIRKAGDTLKASAESALQLKLPAFELPAIKNIGGSAQASASPIQATRAGSSPASRSKVSAAEIKEGGTPGEFGDPRPKEFAETDEDADLKPYQVDVLAGLATLEAIGRKESRRALVAAAAGKAVTSSTFEKYVANLKSRGLVDYGNGTVRLTEEGRAVAKPSASVLTSEDLHEKVMPLFSSYQQKLLRSLIVAHPDSLSRAELGERSGLQSTSSTFEKYVGALRAGEVVEYPDKGHVKAADWLFLE